MARIFVDMDGTLAVWNAGKTIEEVYVPGYFSGLQPQDNVVQAMKSLAKAPGVEVFILSAVFADCPHVIGDKQQWLDKYLPEINVEHRIFAPVPTPKPLAVPGGIRPGDILLDDYSKNLEEWCLAGGMGVKLLNGINHTRGTWTGPKVSKEDPAEEIVNAILAPAALKLISDFIEREYGTITADPFKDLRCIGLAYSTTEDGAHQIQIDVDLIGRCMISKVDNQTVEELKYERMEDLCLDLEYFDFDTAIADAESAWIKNKGGEAK